MDSNALLARDVDYFNTMTPRPDVVLATGDLTDHGTADEYVMLRDILDELEAPLFLIPGNHDETDVLRANYGTPEYVSSTASFDYVVDAQLLAIDTTLAAESDRPSDWPAAKESILARGPMPKGSSAVG